MVATFPFDAHVWSLVISDDNTIAVTPEEVYYPHRRLTIYNFDCSASWHIAEKLHLPMRGLMMVGLPIAAHGDIIVVGIPNVDDDDHGLAQVYNKINGKWIQGQTIKQDGVEHFGLSVSFNEHHMAVSS